MRSANTVLRLLAVASTLTVAVPAYAADACGSLKQLSSINMRLDQTGRPVVSVTIDGQSKLMMLDTGAAISTLTRETIEELDLTPTLREDLVVHDVRGNRIDRSVTPRSFAMGELRATDWRFWIQQGRERLGTTSGGRVAGLLGTDLLRQFDVELDFQRRTVKLFSPDHCEGRVVYWRPSVLAVIPMDVDFAGQISVPVTLDGQRVEAMIDTGAASSVMNLTFARRRFGLDLGRTNTSPYEHRFKTLTLGTLTVANPLIRLQTARQAQAMPFKIGDVTSETTRVFDDVVIGQNVLGNLHIYIAYRERRLYVSD